MPSSALGQLRGGPLAYVGLGSSFVSGTVPHELSQLRMLQKLFLDRTALSGTMPSWQDGGGALARLYLHRTALSGTVPPMAGLGDLYELALSDTRLSGTLPRDLNGSSLAQLYVAETSVSGTIPPEWSRLLPLRRLALYENRLSGSLPAELAALNATLTYCVLSAAQLDQLGADVPRTNRLACGDAAAVPAACRASLPCLQPPPPPPPPPERCTNTCPWAENGVCDDGGHGAGTAACELGTDCTDCTSRLLPREPPPPPSPPPPPPPQPGAPLAPFVGSVVGGLILLVLAAVGLTLRHSHRQRDVLLIEMSERSERMDVRRGRGCEVLEMRAYLEEVVQGMGLRLSGTAAAASAAPSGTKSGRFSGRSGKRAARSGKLPLQQQHRPASPPDAPSAVDAALEEGVDADADAEAAGGAGGGSRRRRRRRRRRRQRRALRLGAGGVGERVAARGRAGRDALHAREPGPRARGHGAWSCGDGGGVRGPCGGGARGRRGRRRP